LRHASRIRRYEGRTQFPLDCTPEQPLDDMTDPSSPTTEPDGSPRSTAQADDGSVHRHATLKKKDSINRATSKRSRAETPGGSMTLSPTSPHPDSGKQNDVTRSPLYCPVPTNADPTVVLGMRFQGTIPHHLLIGIELTVL
jgi:hypothetical protein